MNPLNFQLQRTIELDDYRDEIHSHKKKVEYFEHLSEPDLVLFSGLCSIESPIKGKKPKPRRRRDEEELEDE
jgi:hypothetical protein